MSKKKMMLHEDYKVRVICEGEGWSMVRKHGAYPFVVRSSELRQPTTLAVDLPSGECPKCHNFGGIHFSLCPLANSASH